MVDSTALGLPRARLEDLRGGDAVHNAQVARDLLAGRRGPVRDAVLLNAAGGLVAADGGAGSGPHSLLERLSAGLEVAERSIESGAAAAVLERWVKASSR